MANFAFRLSEVGKTFTEVQILGKCAGAVGNYNAHKVAYPDIDWPTVAAEFVTSLGLGFNPYVTQACLFTSTTFLFARFYLSDSFQLDGFFLRN